MPSTLLDSLIHYQNCRSILCLNGTLPDAAFFRRDLPIIAADGAANALMKIGVKPRLVIGDLDAIDKSLLNKVETLYDYDQDFCDFEKALHYLTAENLLPCIIVGIHGGLLDHVLNNINIFIRSNAVFYAPPLYGCMIKTTEHKSFDLPLNTKLSLFGIPTASVSTQGLKWELSRSALTFPGATSCFNRSIAETIHITVHEGHVLLMIHV